MQNKMEITWVLGFSNAGKTTLINSLVNNEEKIRQVFGISVDQSLIGLSFDIERNSKRRLIQNVQEKIDGRSTDIVLIDYPYQYRSALLKMAKRFRGSISSMRVILLATDTEIHVTRYWAEHRENHLLWERRDPILRALGPDGSGFDKAAAELARRWPLLEQAAHALRDGAIDLGISCEVEVRDSRDRKYQLLNRKSELIGALPVSTSSSNIPSCVTDLPASLPTGMASKARGQLWQLGRWALPGPVKDWIKAVVLKR